MAETVLYVDCLPEADAYRRKLDGIRRYATSQDWSVATISRETVETMSSAALRKIVRKIHPVGCIVESTNPYLLLPPSVFEGLPTVYLDSPEPIPWKEIPAVYCDNASVARSAFRELSAGAPSSYAVVPFFLPLRWNRERTDSFIALCRDAGRPCSVFPAYPDGDHDAILRRCRNDRALEGRISADYSARLASWVAGLPLHCAVFALNDNAAIRTASAFRDAGRPLPRTATLVGADGVEPWPYTELATSISSVRIDFEFAGYAAARLLGSMLARHGSRGHRQSMDEVRKPHTATFGPVLIERRQSTGGHGRCPPQVMSALERIRREACDGLTAAALAEKVPGSRKLLELRFREATGHSILDEIIAVRMARVIDLLSRRDVPIGAIATFSGFGSDIALRKLFHDRIGMSMRAWRRSHV